MRISRITVYRVELPFVDGCYSFAKGKSVSVADAPVVRIETDEGVVGWGEACPLGATYLPACPEGIRAGIGVLGGHRPADNGRLYVGDEPGLGMTPDEDALGEPVAVYV